MPNRKRAVITALLPALLGLSLACGPLIAPAAAAGPAPATATARPIRVLMLVNEGFWAPEYYDPRATFDRAGFEVTVAAKTAGPIAPDARNKDYKPVSAELSFDQVELADYDALTFAGGNGAWTDYFPNDTVHKILSEALARNMVTGLLCASTGLLGVANNYAGQAPLAKGRHVTGYFRVEGILRQLGQVNYDPGDPKQPYVVVDGNLITGRDPMSSQRFGEVMEREIKKALGIGD